MFTRRAPYGVKVQGHVKTPKALIPKHTDSKQECFWQLTHRDWGAVVHLPDLVEDHILDEHSNGLQDKWHKQMHVDVVPCAVELPKTHKDIKYRSRQRPLCFLLNVLQVNSFKKKHMKVSSGFNKVSFNFIKRSDRWNNRSTALALIDLIEEITECIDNKKYALECFSVKRKQCSGNVNKKIQF